MIPLMTIDGPSSSGKSTLMCQLAKKLGWHFLNSGGLYRGLAYVALSEKVNLQDEEKLIALLPKFNMRFELSEADVEAAAPVRFFLNGVDLTREIFMKQCAAASSNIAVLPKVREALLDKQREFWRPPGLIAEGRDMGTVVFPEAPLKLFLQASPETRAKRRAQQLKKMTIDVNLGQLSREIAERDARDETRKIAPLRPAADAVVIDTTVLSPEQVMQFVLDKLSAVHF